MNTVWKQAFIGVTLMAAVACSTTPLFAADSSPSNAPPSRRTSETHPQIRRALKNLEEAKVELNHSMNEFGGHKKTAQDAIDKAIDELKLALEFKPEKKD